MYEMLEIHSTLVSSMLVLAGLTNVVSRENWLISISSFLVGNLAGSFERGESMGVRVGNFSITILAF